jgi:hypothetical protein
LRVIDKPLHFVRCISLAWNNEKTLTKGLFAVSYIDEFIKSMQQCVYGTDKPFYSVTLISLSWNSAGKEIEVQIIYKQSDVIKCKQENPENIFTIICRFSSLPFQLRP